VVERQDQVDERLAARRVGQRPDGRHGQLVRRAAGLDLMVQRLGQLLVQAGQLACCRLRVLYSVGCCATARGGDCEHCAAAAFALFDTDAAPALVHCCCSSCQGSHSCCNARCHTLADDRGEMYAAYCERARINASTKTRAHTRAQRAAPAPTSNATQKRPAHENASRSP
jgi:hypothetical protein